MVEIYDDYEQGERVKKWIKENGSGVLLGIAIAAAGLFGFNYWKAQQQAQGYQAAENYRIVTEQLTELETAIGNADGADGESSDAVASAKAALQQALTNLQGDFSDNLFASLASFKMAEQNIKDDDLNGAVQQYQFIVQNSDNSEMLGLTSLRLARTQLALDQKDAALQSLAAIGADSGYNALAAKVRGEIYLAQGDRASALTAFEQAEQALGDTADRMLELRLADLKELNVDLLLDSAVTTQAPPAFNPASFINPASQPTSQPVSVSASGETVTVINSNGDDSADNDQNDTSDESTEGNE